jgi:hypothetical protein
MNRHDALETSLLEAFDGTNPKVYVWIHWILDQDKHVGARPKDIGNLLNGKGVGGCARTYPHEIETCRHCKAGMLGIGNLGADSHACVDFDLMQPL